MADAFTNRGGEASWGIFLSVTLVLIALLALRYYSRGLREQSGSVHRPAAEKSGRMALVLVGPPPPCARAARGRLTALVGRCRWPASVLCYTQPFDGAALDVRLYPLEALADSPCGAAVAVPWDVDLAVDWDLCIGGCFSPSSTLHSFLVPGCARHDQGRRQAGEALPPPRVVFPARGRAVDIPDFRFVVGRPSELSRYARFWFPSFFAGLLACPLATHLLHVSDPQGPLPAYDPIPGTGCLDRQAITDSERTTLLLLGLWGSPSDTCALCPFVWGMLLESPSPYVQLSQGRRVLCPA